MNTLTIAKLKCYILFNTKKVTQKQSIIRETKYNLRMKEGVERKKERKNETKMKKKKKRNQSTSMPPQKP